MASGHGSLRPPETAPLHYVSAFTRTWKPATSRDSSSPLCISLQADMEACDLPRQLLSIMYQPARGHGSLRPLETAPLHYVSACTRTWKPATSRDSSSPLCISLHAKYRCVMVSPDVVVTARVIVMVSVDVRVMVMVSKLLRYD